MAAYMNCRFCGEPIIYNGPGQVVDQINLRKHRCETKSVDREPMAGRLNALYRERHGPKQGRFLILKKTTNTQEGRVSDAQKRIARID